jgi:xanthine/uracil permease
MVSAGRSYWPRICRVAVIALIVGAIATMVLGTIIEMIVAFKIHPYAVLLVAGTVVLMIGNSVLSHRTRKRGLWRKTRW